MKLLIRIATFAVVVYAGYILLQNSRKDYEEVFEWPKVIIDNGYTYCNPTNYRTCSKSQWFGVIRNTSFEELNPEVKLATSGLIDTACQPRSDPPTSRELRMIESAVGQRIVLCRLKDPGSIDRGKMLMYAENTAYRGAL